MCVLYLAGTSEQRCMPMELGQPEREDYEYRRHGVVDLFVAFGPEEARRIAAKLELHNTPMHASWLNMAEIEIGVLSRQCLAQQMIAFDEMKYQVAVWQFQRNSSSATVVWRFTTTDARCKLKKL